jgi:hypothetical protein
VETEKTLSRALALEPARSKERARGDGLIHQGLMYSEHVHYVEQLRRYHAAFPPEHVLVLIYDDFRVDNEGTVRRVLRFLDVDDTATIEPIEANPSVRVRSPRLNELVRSVYMGDSAATRTIKASIKALTPQRLRHEALAVQRRAQHGTPDAPDERLMLEMRRRFKPEVVALSEYLDRDLVMLWDYGRIG